MRALVSLDFDFFFRELGILDWGHSESDLFKALEDAIWGARVMGAVQAGINLIDLQRVEAWRDVTSFWAILQEKGFVFPISPNPALGFVGETHAEVAMEMLCELEDEEYVLYSFDAHHDLNYKCGETDQDMAADQAFVGSDNWMFNLVLQVPQIRKVVLVYPDWRLERCPLLGKGLDEGYDDLIAARSRYFAKSGIQFDWMHWSDLKRQSPIDVARIGVCQSSAWVPPWFEADFARLVETMPPTERVFSLFSDLFTVREEWNKPWDELIKPFIVVGDGVKF